MVETIKTLQIVFGIIIALVMVGWCSWRLLILWGLIAAPKPKKLTPNHRKGNHETEHAKGKPGTASVKKKGAATLSRQALYSSRKHPE